MKASEINSCYYAKLATQPDALVSYLKELNKEDQYWEEHFGFGAIELDLDLLKTDLALRVINNVQKIDRLGLLRIEPSTFYYWHTDTHRQSCINMLVSPPDHHSHTLFGREISEQNREIVELKYEPGAFYLFNNQAEHCVVNLDGPRYVFSVYFKEEMPYKAVRQRMQQAKLLAK